MWQLFLVVLAIVAICFLGLGFNIFFRKDGKFPETEIEHNMEMRKRGIRCAKEDEMRIWGRKGKAPDCGDASCGECKACR